MKEGVMFVIQNGQISRMEVDVAYEDGTTVKTDGTVKLSDGTTLVLPEGMIVTVDGRLRMRDGFVSVQEPPAFSSAEATAGMPPSADNSAPAPSPQAAAESAIYTIYSDAVLHDGKTKVFFFHASWCPECKEADATLKTWLPSTEFSRSVYKVDYDTAKDLKAKYGVIYQHTFVVVDGQGTKVSLVQGPTDEQLKALLK
jgi:thiol-disulfide isomerase/thioredoxin